MSDIPEQSLAGRLVGDEHHLLVRVYYEDTDFSGVVYYANYMKFFERGRSDYLRLIGVHHYELAQMDPPLAFAVTHIDITYKAPAKIDDIVLVRSRSTGVKGAQFFLHQRIERDGVLLCEAHFDAVCIGFDGRPRRLPRLLVNAINHTVTDKKPE
ncbi:tol-pal system-associated acyl-CoA thioesterase [Asticcacaulis biprosthecium C19]|uniref:Tol-pal system-associated acyl-CoA thioesterase n=1 Tax=Asticcacaulis biprosthecium C19 TaxID=715226 RepID=F4QKQ6_9CAUL|nr:YbgC/FadM family acyl-CoA thioesterase [Asticcacaulis biprosthecium]EGF93358.1 tol-pal system-associated acyl-CoA thioesterase [Asticcacaulis biprosthecium C19]